MFKSSLMTFVAGLTLLGLNREDVHQPLTDARIPLDPGHSVTQSFVASKNNLNIVYLCLKNPSRALAPLTFSLRVVGESEPKRVINFSGGNVDNQDCTRFQFEQLRDSQGKNYLVSVEYPLGFQDDEKTGIYAEATSTEYLRDGEAYLDGTELPLDLHFKTTYRESLTQVLTQALQDFATRLTQDLGFVLAYFVLLIVVFNRLKKSS